MPLPLQTSKSEILPLVKFAPVLSLLTISFIINYVVSREHLLLPALIQSDFRRHRICACLSCSAGSC